MNSFMVEGNNEEDMETWQKLKIQIFGDFTEGPLLLTGMRMIVREL